MTTLQDTAPAHAVQAYDDTMGIGQVACARIRLAVHSLSARGNAAQLLSNAYVPDVMLPALSRMIRADIAAIERAKAVIGGAA